MSSINRETGSPVFAGVRTVRLPERLKDELLLFGGNTRTGIDHGEACQNLGTTALFHSDLQPHRARVRKLDRVAQQILQNLAQPVRIAQDRIRRFARGLGAQMEAFFVGPRRQKSSQRARCTGGERIGWELIPELPPNLYIPCSTISWISRRLKLAVSASVNFDISVMKDTHITERFTHELRVEFFNTMNKANFQAPVTHLNNPNFRRILAANLGRQLQIAMKLKW
jgi:hypothetical protein